MLRDPRTSGDSIDRDDAPDGPPSLDRLIAAAAFDPAALDPAQVRAVILAEHRKIRVLLKRLEADAIALLACSVPREAARNALVQRAFDLCEQMEAHIAFENQVLVPVVGVVDAWGPVRAQSIVEDHADQLHQLRAYADMLVSNSESNPGVSVTVWQLVQSISQDMREEEAQLLVPEFLSDRVDYNVETG